MQGRYSNGYFRKVKICLISCIMLQIIQSFPKISVSRVTNLCGNFFKCKFWARKDSIILHVLSYAIKHKSLGYRTRSKIKLKVIFIWILWTNYSSSCPWVIDLFIFHLWIFKVPSLLIIGLFFESCRFTVNIFRISLLSCFRLIISCINQELMICVTDRPPVFSPNIKPFSASST